MSSEMTLTTMQERLGGAAALAGIVETFYALALNDPALAPVFARVDLDALQRHQEHFLGFVLATDDPAIGARITPAWKLPPGSSRRWRSISRQRWFVPASRRNWCARLPRTSTGCAMTSWDAEPAAQELWLSSRAYCPATGTCPSLGMSTCGWVLPSH
jgi:hypothetical protein